MKRMQLLLFFTPCLLMSSAWGMNAEKAFPFKMTFDQLPYIKKLDSEYYPVIKEDSKFYDDVSYFVNSTLFNWIAFQ